MLQKRGREAARLLFSLFFVLQFFFFLPVSTQIVDGHCECKIENTESQVAPRAPAPFSENECTGSPDSEYLGCEWSPSQVAGQRGVCYCQKKEAVTQSFPRVDRATCAEPFRMQESVGPNQQVVSCNWVGEVPEDEEGQLFSAKLRTDIRELNKFSPDTGVTQLIGIFIKTAMGVMGTFALVIFIYGGINWMLARGDSDMQRKGFDTLVWGALGIAVMLSSYALADYIFEAFR